MSRKRTLVFAAAAAGSLALPAAADVKNYHGAGCFTDAGSATASGVGLTTNSAGNVWCGLTRDRTNNSGDIISSYVELFNAASGSIACAVTTQREDQTSATAATILATASAASGSAVGNTQAGPMAPATTAGNEGAYFVNCALDEGDIFYHIYVNERTTTD